MGNHGGGNGCREFRRRRACRNGRARSVPRMRFLRPVRLYRVVTSIALVAFLTASGVISASGQPSNRERWFAVDVPAWDISNEGLPFRATWAWASPVDPLGRLLGAAETRWTASVGYAKVYNSYDGATGVFRNPGGHAALASAGREFRWRLDLGEQRVVSRWLPTALIEFGVHGATRRFPADGTQFNFKLLSGLEWPVSRGGWTAALIWSHFSNANVLSRNSGYDGLALRFSRPCGPRRAR